MSKQWQIRRGTTAENDAFTGASGEITMDTEKKAIRIHDGSTQGGIKIPSETTADYVVESQLPTAENNYTWYRKYRSGWVEQGGIQTGNTPISVGSAGSIGEITLPVEMQDANYYANAHDTTYCMLGNVVKTSTTVQFQFLPYQANRNLTTVFWEVSGMAK